MLTPDKKEDVLLRLKRLEGQIRGVQKMVDQDKYCVDIMIQLAAVRSATRNVGKEILESHAHSCVLEAIQSDNIDSDETIDELIDVIFKFNK